MNNWSKNLEAAITVCDRDGIIVEMNERSVQYWARQGGRDLYGRSLLDCHPEPSRSQIQDMLVHPRSNTYIIDKNGTRKLIHQSPWYENGQLGGYVEFIIELEGEIPIKIRSEDPNTK